MSDSEHTRSRRPALRKLTADLAELRHELVDVDDPGLGDHVDVLDWLQRLCVRTLGQVHSSRYETIGENFIPDSKGREGSLLAALLSPEHRRREMDEQLAREVRAEFSNRTIGTARHPAFRSLRKDAGSYVGEPDDDGRGDPGFEPEQQRYTGMRPVLDELAGYQSDALHQFVEGFDAKEEVLDWGDTLELATHGEPVLEDRPGQFATRCYAEPPMRELLLGERAYHERARETYAAMWLLPAFNRGVQDLAGRSAEEPTFDNSSDMGEPPGWKS